MSWEQTTVGSISKQIRGVTYDKSDLSSDSSDKYITLLRAGNIQNGEILLEDLVYVDRSRVVPKQLLRAGDVLIAASSGSLSMVGKAARVREDHDTAFGAFCKVLRPDITKVDPNYFGHFFQTEAYRNIISTLAQGANINNIRGEHLDDLEIPLPPLPIQQRIAAVLDEVDALRQKRERSLEMVDGLQLAIFMEMFGDANENLKGFPVKKAGNLLSLKPQIGTIVPVSADGNVKTVRVGELGNDRINIDKCMSIFNSGKENAKYLLSDGDLLFARAIGSESHLGKASLYKGEDGEMIFDSHVMRIRFRTDQVNPIYFLVWLKTQGGRSKFMQRAGRTAVQFNINSLQFSNIDINLPPVGLQNEFARIYEQTNEERSKLIEQLLNFREMDSSLQAHAFSGTLALRELAEV